MSKNITVHSPDRQTAKMRMQTEIELLKDKLYNMTRERDHLLKDVTEIANHVDDETICKCCAHHIAHLPPEENDCECYIYDEDFDEYSGKCEFKWRGVCPENTPDLREGQNEQD